DALQILGRVDEASGALGSGGRQEDGNSLGHVSLGIVQVDVPSRVIHDAPPVRLGIARVVRLMVRVTAKIASVGQGRVQIPYALVVGKEIDAATDPHWVHQVPVGLRPPNETALAVRIDPEVARGTAPVTFPIGRIAGVTVKYNAPTRIHSHEIGRTPGQFFRLAPSRCNTIWKPPAGERRFSVRSEQDVSVRMPT